MLPITSGLSRSCWLTLSRVNDMVTLPKNGESEKTVDCAELRLFAADEKNTEASRLLLVIGFDDVGGSLCTDTVKAGLGQGITEGIPVKAKMKDTGVVVMKAALFQIKIGDAQTATGHEYGKEVGKQGFDVAHMMKRHAADHEIIAARQVFPMLQITEHGASIGQFEVGDLAVEHSQHAV